ncbi:hypothetical protein ACFWBC_32590 [Streptomyces sp. NPDC059985]|uniref:hypothetical protein n=1 Tax=Streptomyces sp. NPDC059985 TaxID=3347025 RepID=UPI003681A9B0
MTDKTPQGDGLKGTRPNPGPASDAGEMKPATLTLANTDGVPNLTATGGNAIPGEIRVLDDKGQVCAVYTAGPYTEPSPALGTRSTRSTEPETFIDRPFLYTIYHRPTDPTLFSGTLLKP